MRLQIVKSKNAASLYIVKSIYENKKRSNKIVCKLGTLAELSKVHSDPISWGKSEAERLTAEEKAASRKIMVEFNPNHYIPENNQQTYNGGYLFLQKIFYELGLDRICSTISSRHSFSFNLCSILSRLIYGRILFPASKLSTNETSKLLIEQPDFELHEIYRALDIIAEENDYIQAALFSNSIAKFKRNTSVIYYDCTNFFFETEMAEGLKQYGHSKENRPNPIVEMGLFMDSEGIPLAFSISPGNTNEQITLKPLEKKLIENSDLRKFVVCTDAGLNSETNRRFNNISGRGFLVTQSIKKTKKHIHDWCLEPTGWHLPNSSKSFNINEIDEEKYWNDVFYKDRWINENGLEQHLIVSFSFKYRDYQSSIRNRQLLRAEALVKKGKSAIASKRANDPKRFIKGTSITSEGEIAKKTVYSLDSAVALKEAQYDGFYAVCTNLEDSPADIIRVNKRRWEIEECFRIMKTEFKARPVYVKMDNRITAHFTTCFLALVVYKFLEKKLSEQYTCGKILDTLKDMNFLKIRGDGYIPLYKRTEITEALHECFGFRTDYEIITNSQLKKIFRLSKS